MGAVASEAVNGIGNFLGNALTAPFKRIFNASCQDICAGPWDLICFIEHLCVSKLFNFFMILCLCFTILIFLYVLLKLGICKCITKSLCHICWAGCETYCFVCTFIPHILWYKLINTQRVNRRHQPWRRRTQFQDIESGCIWSSESDCDSSYYYDYHRHNHRGWSRERNRKRKSHKLRSINGIHRNRGSLSKRKVSINGNGSFRRLRSRRRLRLINVRRPKEGIKRISKRRGVR